MQRTCDSGRHADAARFRRRVERLRAWRRAIRLRAARRAGRLRASQSGATLVVSLVLLSALTVLGLSGMSTAALEVTMAGNAQFQEDAFVFAENGIALVIAERLYSTDGERTLPWRGTPNADRRAVATFRAATPVLDRAFSVDAVAAFHFEVVADGVGPRNAASTHTQGFYVLGPAR